MYQFDELSSEAKQKAMAWYREGEDFEYIFSEVRNTLDAFCAVFPVKWSAFDPDEPYRSSWSINLDDHIEELTGWRLATYLWNNYRTELFEGKYYGKWVSVEKSAEHPHGTRHVSRHSRVILDKCCVLTGVCYDDSLLDPIYKFLDSPQENINLRDLLDECFHSLLEDVGSELEDLRSDEAIIEAIEANEYEFTEDGGKY